MTAPWRMEFPQSRTLAETARGAIPRIETDRLILRAPQISDWDVLETIWTTDRGRYIGGPFNEEDAYLDFAQSVAGWTLRGLGALTIEDRQTGAVLGLTGIFVEFGDPENIPEVGWILTEAAEGEGIAEEAARAVLKFAFEDLGFTDLVSYIASGNDRSEALARRLGAVADTDPFIDADGDTTRTFRHSKRGQA